MEITKEIFEQVHANHPPFKIEKFYFKYFSKETKSKDNWVSWLVYGILFIPFLIGLIGSIINTHIKMIKIATIIFISLLIIFAIPWIFTWYMHNLRIRKIRKELGVSIEEYESLTSQFL